MKGGGGKAEMGVGKEELVSEANILIMKSRIKKGTNERVVVVFVQHLLNVTDGLNKYFHHSRRRRRRREEFLSSVVNAIKHFFGGNLENLDSPMDEQAIIRHFKSNKQCYSIVKLKKSIVLHIFVLVQASEQTLFNFLLLGKSIFPPKIVF